MRTTKARTLLGGILMILLTLAYPFLHIPNIFPGVAIILIDMLYFLVLAAALALLGVVRIFEKPLNLLPAILYASFLLLHRVASQMTQLTIQQWVWTDVASIGILLFGVSAVALALSLLHPSRSWGFDIHLAIYLFALVAFACVYPYLQRQIGTMSNKIDPYAVLLSFSLHILCGLFLLPFLQSNRTGGIWLACLGAFLLLAYAAYYIVTYHTAWGHMHQSGYLRSLLSIFFVSKNISLFVGFLGGGIWCIFSGGKPQAAAQ